MRQCNPPDSQAYLAAPIRMMDHFIRLMPLLAHKYNLHTINKWLTQTRNQVVHETENGRADFMETRVFVIPHTASYLWPYSSYLTWSHITWSHIIQFYFQPTAFDSGCLCISRALACLRFETVTI